MKEAQFFRKDHVIKDANGKVVFTGIVKIGGKEFASINKAKAESRRLQMESDKALGRGTVRLAS